MNKHQNRIKLWRTFYLKKLTPNYFAQNSKVSCFDLLLIQKQNISVLSLGK